MIILPAIVESIVSRKDRTWKVSFGTQEMSPDKAAALLTMNQQLCYLAIKPEHFHEEEQQLLDELKADQELTGNATGIANATSGSATAIPAGTTIDGIFTSIKLHAGSVIAYRK